MAHRILFGVIHLTLTILTGLTLVLYLLSWIHNSRITARDIRSTTETPGPWRAVRVTGGGGRAMANTHFLTHSIKS